MSKQISLTGDWRKLRRFLSSTEDVIDSINNGIREEAERIAEAIKDEIPYYAEPNAPSTVERKGFDAPLLEDGDFKMDGIVVKESADENRSYKKYYVIKGDPDALVQSGDRDHDGLTFEGLLEIMENGESRAGRHHNINIPKRPIMTIAFDRMKNKVSQKLIMKMKDEVHKRMRGD
jgi:hypothetical protein